MITWHFLISCAGPLLILPCWRRGGREFLTSWEDLVSKELFAPSWVRSLDFQDPLSLGYGLVWKLNPVGDQLAEIQVSFSTSVWHMWDMDRLVIAWFVFWDKKCGLTLAYYFRPVICKIKKTVNLFFSLLFLSVFVINCHVSLLCMCAVFDWYFLPFAEAFQRARKKMEEARKSLPQDLISSASQLQIESSA